MVPPNQVVIDQADLFQVDGYTRITGIVPSGLTCAVYYNNVPQSWPLVDGSFTTDVQIASGNVYWNEIGIATGFYSVRFFPNAIGFWRIVLRYGAGSLEVTRDYDVRDLTSTDEGLVTSFIGG
jgi:hypothetical protein